MKIVVIILVVIGVILLFINQSIVITIQNVGKEPLSNVVVHVTGNSYQIGDIQVGSNKSVKVSPTGESHIEIEHSKGRLIVDTYFESGYRGNISIEVTSTDVKRIQDEISVGIF